MTVRRIALFLPYLAPYPSAGSMRATSLLHGLLVERERMGSDIQIRVYTATADPAPVDGIEIVSLPFRFPENTASFVRRLFAEVMIGLIAAVRILTYTRRGDLILLSSPLFVPALLTGLGAALVRCRYILDIRDLYPLVYSDAGLMSKTSVLFRILTRLERAWISRASLVLAATNGLARHVREAGAKLVITVFNGYPERLAKLPADKRERFTACFHGVLGQFQDVESVIEVAGRLEPYGIDVVVVGYGVKAKLLDEAKLANLDFRGRLPFDETAKVVAQCHVGLCLRRGGEISSDAFPVKVWECLGLGLPSVVTPHCEAGEFLASRDIGAQFAAGDIDAIVEWIVTLRDDRVRYDRMAARCRAVRTEYTRETIGERAARDILELLAPTAASVAR